MSSTHNMIHSLYLDDAHVLDGCIDLLLFFDLRPHLVSTPTHRCNRVFCQDMAQPSCCSRRLGEPNHGERRTPQRGCCSPHISWHEVEDRLGLLGREIVSRRAQLSERLAELVYLGSVDAIVPKVGAVEDRQLADEALWWDRGLVWSVGDYGKLWYIQGNFVVWFRVQT